MKALLFSLFLLINTTIQCVGFSDTSIQSVCQHANINNDVACNQNKLSQFSLHEYQKITRWLESNNQDEEYGHLLEEIYYYYGLNLLLDNNNLDLDVIAQWEKIKQSKTLIDRVQTKLDDLYLKFGYISKIKGNDLIEEIREYNNMDLDERLEVSPYSESLLREKIDDLWKDIIDYSSNSNIQTSSDDFLIIFANDLTTCYKNLISKHGKKYSLEERSEYFSILSDIEFLMLNNFKQSQLFAKQCIELDDSNKHCLDLIKLNGRLLSLKSKSNFDPLVIDRNVNIKWKNEFTKMINDQKGMNTFTKISDRVTDFYKNNNKSKFKKLYNGMPYQELLTIYKSIVEDLSTKKFNNQANNKKVKTLLSSIRIKDIKSIKDLKTVLTSEHLQHLWHDKSPYICLNVIAYLINNEQFINDKFVIKIGDVFNFLNNEKVIHMGNDKLDDFSFSIIQGVKRIFEERQMKERILREKQQQQQQEQFFRQFQGGGYEQFFQGGNTGGHRGQRHQAPPPEHSQFSKEKDYYKILNTSPKATEKEIRKSFLNLIKKYHPDKLSNLSDDEKVKMEETVHNINEAYEVLYDEQKRREYDRFRSM
ncbi:unnamed protein product [Hanseniaspora opuntiae]|uniref:DnaJ-like chaperone JEM1 n=1 Tax=Hanseniaspora opuntiae TaxID=211096 RepID=A0A1E5RTM4_9ASCO|nr:DnaJ-like chaperone JEM1 [Hanseniaspora opuntiae]